MTRVREDKDLRDLLEAVDMEPGDVDIVIHSHLHRDHISWNVVVDEDGTLVPMFPNAVHYIQQAEFAYWGSSDLLHKQCQWDTYIVRTARAGRNAKTHR